MSHIYQYSIIGLEIIYSHECVEGDDILVYTKEVDDIIYVFGLIKSSNLTSFKS